MMNYLMSKNYVYTIVVGFFFPKFFFKIVNFNLIF
jgi:hypothetical protein